MESEDKKRSRINVISHILETIPYQRIVADLPQIPDRPTSDGGYERPDRSDFKYVPDVAARLERDAPKKKNSSHKGGS